MIWRLIQIGIVGLFLYVDYAAPMDGEHRPGLFLIVGILVAAAVTVCATAAIDGTRSVFRRLFKRGSAHVGEPESQSLGLSAARGEFGKPLQEPPRIRRR
jgi:hypothetical protein